MQQHFLIFYFSLSLRYFLLSYIYIFSIIIIYVLVVIVSLDLSMVHHNTVYSIVTSFQITNLWLYYYSALFG